MDDHITDPKDVAVDQVAEGVPARRAFRPLRVWPTVLLIVLMIAARFVLLRPPLTRQAVMAWLAGICLIDAFFLMLLDQSAMALLAGACFGLTLAAHRFIAGT